MTEQPYQSISAGDFVRPRPAGNAHIAYEVHPTLHGTGQTVTTLCNAVWHSNGLKREVGHPARQCQKCLIELDAYGKGRRR